MDYQTFSPAWLDAALDLLAHEHIQAGPVLPQRTHFQAGLSELLAAGAIGAVAVDAGRLQGFLLAEIHRDEFYGISARVPLVGHAVCAPELYAGLYAEASGLWVRQGARKHQLQLAVHDLATIQAWFELSFGREQLYGVRPLEAGTAATDPQIRRARPADLDALEPLLSLILESYAQGPIWEPFVPAQRPALRQAYASLLEDPEAQLWLAVTEAGPVAFQMYLPSCPDLMVPEASWDLCTAATSPAGRRQGWQQRLLNAAAPRLYDLGARWLFCDWRSTSLSASATWPALGFKPLAWRLTRQLTSNS